MKTYGYLLKTNTEQNSDKSIEITIMLINHLIKFKRSLGNTAKQMLPLQVTRIATFNKHEGMRVTLDIFQE